MCITQKNKKSYLEPKSMIRNSLSLSHFSEFNVKFTKQKISHLNIKKEEEEEEE
jgi:hypothetical protein